MHLSSICDETKGGGARNYDSSVFSICYQPSSHGASFSIKNTLGGTGDCYESRGVIWGGWGAVAPSPRKKKKKKKKEKEKKKKKRKKEGNYE